MLIAPQNNRDLKQGVLHLWSKFGDPSLNGWWVMAQTSSGLTSTHMRTHTDTHRQTYRCRQWQRPKGPNWAQMKQASINTLRSAQKGLTFWRQNFRKHLSEMKCVDFYSNLFEIAPQGQVSTGPFNILAQTDDKPLPKWTKDSSMMPYGITRTE